jgi:hypothetical protein
MGEATSTSLEIGNGRDARSGERVSRGSGAVLFPELVWAHFLWQQETGQGPGGPPRARAQAQEGDGDMDSWRMRESEAVYRTKLRDFQTAEGDILDAYWCWSEASAVALTGKRPRRLSLRRRPRQIHLHRATDWATMRIHAVAELIHHFDSLAIRVSEILTPAPKRIAMERIFAEESYLLGFTEKTERAPTDAELAALTRRQRQTLRDIEGYYDRAAQNAARIYYFFGMMAGLALLAAGAAAVVVPLMFVAEVDLTEFRDYLSSYSAGAVGAVVSVMSRMRQDPRSPQAFRVDYEVGKAPLWFLGGVRPVLGAIFGTATFFALQSGLIQLTPEGPRSEFYFYALLGFLAGFSERFAHVILSQAEGAASPASTAINRRGRAEPKTVTSGETVD